MSYSVNAREFVERNINLIDEQDWFTFLCKTFYENDDYPYALHEVEMKDVLQMLADAKIVIPEKIFEDVLLYELEPQLQDLLRSKLQVNTIWFIDHYMDHTLGYSKGEIAQFIYSHQSKLNIKFNNNGIIEKA